MASRAYAEATATPVSAVTSANGSADGLTLSDCTGAGATHHPGLIMAKRLAGTPPESPPRCHDHREAGGVRVRSVARNSGKPVEQARVFGQVADDYARTRPGYPAAAVGWLVGSAPRRVLDLGAGTGKLTGALVVAGHDVVAVEPSQQMLAILRTTVPSADARDGSAESIPVPDATMDIVVVAQAFHWFDHATAVPEIARVLKPGGRLGLVWNLRDESTPWVAELSLVIGSEDALPEEVAPALSVARTHFDEFETAQFQHSQRLDRDTLLGLVRSRSYVAIRPADEQNAIYAEVDRLFDRFADPDALTLPYVTQCYRGARIPSPQPLDRFASPHAGSGSQEHPASTKEANR